VSVASHHEFRRCCQALYVNAVAVLGTVNCRHNVAGCSCTTTHQDMGAPQEIRELYQQEWLADKVQSRAVTVVPVEETKAMLLRPWNLSFNKHSKNGRAQISIKWCTANADFKCARG